MPDLYLIIVVLLFTLAVSDLIVGVSNDAVNFLNSAIGSKVASRKMILVVASLGILMGATFSSGMMDVARKGIFNPDYFYFSEIMTIFIAVMITDIILLDLFNTFGMPTSTTVSIVFELLGAAVGVSILKIFAAGDSLGTLGEYINSSSAVIIISGIFISVLIAFVIGTGVQYFSRLLFTFHIDKRMRWVGAIWSGFALSALTYFLLIKGVKGASFISVDFINWVIENTVLLLGISFVFWTVLMQVLLVYFKVNVLRIIVLFGTFAIAMAFAGNDLVNFIGVPIAGFESYQAWDASALPPEQFSMNILNSPIRTQTYLLLLAGIIMIGTLWFSKKARSVTETEVNLGRQEEGNERFEPNVLAQGIVRYALLLGKKIQQILPERWINKANKNFQPLKNAVGLDAPAFDLLRASVNLTVASMLIAFATSLKLPLSTTYVSFMVAMGASLADRAWGRSSAVYRISGVMNVIGGWFLTAFIAFSAAAVFAILIYYFQLWAIISLVGLAVYLISRTFLFHHKKEAAKQKIQDFVYRSEAITPASVIMETADEVALTLEAVKNAFHESLDGLLTEDRKKLAKAQKDILQVKAENELLQRELYNLIKKIEEKDIEIGRIYLFVYDLNQDILQSTSLMVTTCTEYIENSLVPLSRKQSMLLNSMLTPSDQYFDLLIGMSKKLNFENLQLVLDRKQQLFEQLEYAMDQQMKGIKKESFGLRNSLLIFTLLLEVKDLIAVAARFAKLFHRIQKSKTGATNPLVTNDSAGST